MASWTFGLLLMAVVISTVSSQCPTPSEINGGNGEFQSPNFGEEYGKKANCTWRFSSNSLTKYALKLEVKVLRLYITQNGGKVCVHGSYNLSINGDLVECDKYAKEDRSVTFCHAYYNGDTCEFLPDVRGCEVSQRIEFPVEVKYNADGRTISTVSLPANVVGFKIGYQFIRCPDRLTTTKPEPITTLPTKTTQAGSNQTVSADVTQMTSRQMQEMPSTKTATECACSNVIEYRDNPITIAAAVAGSVGLTILVETVVYTMKRCLSNRNRRTKGQVEAAPVENNNDQAYQTYEQVNNANTTTNLTREEKPVYEIPNTTEHQEITLDENPGYDNPNLPNPQQTASGYESVNYSESHLYERPK